MTFAGCYLSPNLYLAAWRLLRRERARFFMTAFSKPALSLTDQVNHLLAKGLIISDLGQATEALRQHGLHRFKGTFKVALRL